MRYPSVKLRLKNRAKLQSPFDNELSMQIKGMLGQKSVCLCNDLGLSAAGTKFQRWINDKDNPGEPPLLNPPSEMSSHAS